MPHKRRRGNDSIRDTIVVETSDGARLRCSISMIGRETEPRWMILDLKGEQYVGPVVTMDRTPEGIRRLIDRWWTARRPE
jgi:hypothetical protein